MAKNIIRLTESDLHRIVKESVERILRESVNEVELGGESLHGDNAEDWFAVSNLRDRNAKRDKKLATSKFYKNNNDAMNSYFNNTIEGGRDWRNGTNLAKQGLGKALDGGRDKSNRIIKNLDPRDF